MTYYNTSGLNPATFLSLPGKIAEESFNNLSALEQIQVCLLAPWEKRIDLLLLSKDISEIIQNFPAEELFWTIKSVSPEDALLILPHVKAEQVQFFFDLEWWHKQDLRTDSIASWLFLFFETDEMSLSAWLNWISKEDEALIPLILRQFIMVQKKPDDMDIMEAKDVLYGYTIDNIFFIDFRSDKLAPLIDRFLRTIFDFSPEYYFGIMDSILWETKTESLENAFRLRNGRLADYGIPQYYEAIEILTPLPFGKVRKIDPHIYLQSGINEDFFPPFIPTLYQGDFPILNQALAPLYGRNTMERIINEWIGVANKLMISNLEDFNDPKMMEKTLIGVGSLLNLGISIQGKIETKNSFTEILEVSVLEDLVRIAISGLLEIRKKVNALISQGLLPHGLAYLPETWQNIINPLNNTIPMYLDNKEEIFFSDISQIEEYEDFISDIYVWGVIMSEVNPNWSKWDFELDFRNTNLLNPNEFLWHKGLLTAFANVSLYGVFKIIPVPEFELVPLKEMWFPETDSVPEKTINMCLHILEHIITKHNLPEERVKRIIYECLEELRFEWENIPKHSHLIDGRFTSSILVKLSEIKDDEEMEGENDNDT